MFILAMIKSFITDYSEEGNPLPVREFIKIAFRYLKSNFPLDFLVLIPFHWLLGDFMRESNYLFLIKSLRIIRGLDLLSVSKLKEIAKSHFKSKTEEAIKHDRSIGDDKENEHNNIGTVITIGFVGQTLILVFMLICSSYFGGVIWLLWCDYSKSHLLLDGETSFLDAYQM